MRRAESVIDSAIATLAQECGLSNETDHSAQSTKRPSDSEQGLYILTKGIQCPQTSDPEKKVQKALLVAEKHLAVVKTEQMNIAQDITDMSQSNPSFSARDTDFIRKVRKRVSTFSIILACLVTIALRIVSSCFLNSDADVGLERIIKFQLGFQCWVASAPKTRSFAVRAEEPGREVL